MEQRKAIHYGKLELIPGIICDVYILDDNTPVMSERGTADLLDMKHVSLRSVVATWPPKTLKPFINKAASVVATLAKVEAKNSPHQGRNIVVYDSKMIATIISAYVMAAGHNSLQKNQLHIGKRCSILIPALITTTLDTAIEQICGLPINIQQTVQEQCIKLMKQYGLTTSFPEEKLYTKKDITAFLEKPLSTVNSYVRKHNIPHENLDYQTIKANGGKANRMNGYNLEAVSKIVLGMDSVVGIKLKKQIFGNTGTLVRTDTKGEIEWQQVLAQVFDGFGFHHNYTFGSYRVDFFIQDLNLILECNGYDNHRNYNQQEEKQREKLLKKNYSIIRFHHKITPEQLFNGILKTKMGKVVKLYEIEPVYPKVLSL
ncbi:DUF559 domain-containing protein [Candidatus Halobeggiatoa sp. HSG11]|nr:DUF559 domain-containing protein [Candidatus Halobeggiatoa sp. HSG11]